ncbi:endoplasmic reticulum metallopeptidase 1 [Mytilinidion resinicola]|uniref:Peptide hydrolase n=1 Tax=Mytilinidion resinicola TaxID=574789 RepID=A0A6A6Y881_9PEZI|nr:endoplasmic reticulum metallopeptidase 1 [Mytilinidion resinicola]KAF2805022.1 endoplasmic reticulum metallopeptidase 1 [Mytilinidion resinicola]
MARLSNPLAFTPLPVIVVTTLTYAALFAALLVVHLTVPPVPSSVPDGINLTTAWSNLQAITSQFHPYNTHANDHVHDYLLHHVKTTLKSNGVSYDSIPGAADLSLDEILESSESRVLLFDDQISNVTFSNGGTSVYFEGTNIIVLIRGSEGTENVFSDSSSGKGGVLVNAHYDSVSTGFGATDDGVGVVTILQLLSHFTAEKSWPKRNIVLLLNNGEEDFLNGARAFLRHPVSQLAHTFLNLEGAGAGGRAMMFRSTDADVTKYYKKASNPYGTVVSADGFKRRLIRSETDYVVFNGLLGLRGLDIAFNEPRARYHTSEDSARETSMKSVWHMLSAALATVSGLASDTSSTFDGSGETTSDGKVDAGKGPQAVWFDLFGKAFVILRLNTMFALCVTLLVVAPLALIAVTVILAKVDKMYLFARKQYVHSEDDNEAVEINGWRGVFRFPIAFVVATAAVIGLAYLVLRVNPYIAYSSPFAIWVMMLSAWYSVAWFILRGADAMRPSALHRLYSLIWLFAGGFVILVLVTVAARNFDLASGYFMLIYFAATFLSVLIGYLELFALPKKSIFVSSFDDGASHIDSESTSRPLTGGASRISEDRPLLRDDDTDTETTSLLRNDRQSFARYGTRRESVSEGHTQDEDHPKQDFGNHYTDEQAWSGSLPSWLWILQFLLLAPIVIILIGQIGLVLTTGLYQTTADGSSALLVYVAIAILSALILSPLGPFLHRFTYHVPAFIFLVCIGTLIYNLCAFPFSRDHRLKVYFQQQTNCETGSNSVSLIGLDQYVQQIVAQVPSAAGQALNCTTPDIAIRKELIKCSWKGPQAHPISVTTGNRTYIDSWLNFNVTKTPGKNQARFHIVGQNTRACKAVFNTPITSLEVEGGAPDSRFPTAGQNGSTEVRLWHRDWSKAWDFDVNWGGEFREPLSGSIICLWSDANDFSIAALSEVRHYMPIWSIATKYADGLLEGSKGFSV